MRTANGFDPRLAAARGGSAFISARYQVEKSERYGTPAATPCRPFESIRGRLQQGRLPFCSTSFWVAKMPAYTTLRRYTYPTQCKFCSNYRRPRCIISDILHGIAGRLWEFCNTSKFAISQGRRTYTSARLATTINARLVQKRKKITLAFCSSTATYTW
eukprot:GHVT01037523.1.p1 GENE.GHVT01037523.1~~GHVT01037523.1.p1  ORF type:complete len:159 (-),score=7.35 GHVT01037523.1:1477-1953(-)